MNYDEIKAVNWSTLKLIEHSPLMYFWAVNHGKDKDDDTPSRLLGRAIHCAILEPEEFNRRYMVRPIEWNARTKTGRAALQYWLKHGFEVLTPTQFETVQWCSASIMSHKPASELLEGTKREQTITWTAQGVRCKGRLDFIGDSYFGDIKTTRNLRMFQRDFAKYLYHGQMAFYNDGLEECHSLFDSEIEPYIIAVETKPPYDCAAFHIPYDVICAGRRLYQRLFDTLLACQETNMWPGRYPALANIDLPHWAFEEE